MDTQDLSIAGMGRALRAGTVTATSLAQDALQRIGARDGGLHAFVLTIPVEAGYGGPDFIVDNPPVS